MALSVTEMAEKYYPRLWSVNRLKALVEAGKMDEADYNRITGFVYPATKQMFYLVNVLMLEKKLNKS